MTTIEWTEETFNPIRARNLKTGGLGHYCAAVSAGCKNCYAERLQPRYKNYIRYAAQDRALVDVFLDEKVLRKPLGWKAPRKIFPCSMTDLFGDFVKDEWIDEVFAIAALTPQHTYQVLTKRPERMMKYLLAWPHGAARKHAVFSAAHRILNRISGKTSWSSSDPEFARAQEALRVWPLPNWWQGVSVEDQENANERIPHLIAAPVAVRWISAEPLLGHLDLHKIHIRDGLHGSALQNQRDGNFFSSDAHLDWVVVGGESGPKARPFDLAWADAIVAQCKEAEVPVFVKQLGARPRQKVDGLPGIIPLHTKDRKGGDPAEWPERLRVRQYPAKGCV